MNILNEFYERVITEITAKGIYEGGRIIVEQAQLKDAIKSIKEDILNEKM